MSNTMREILFRGKRVDNGEWVYGTYGRHTSFDAMIIDRPYLDSNGDLTALNFWTVNPETVGQFTGLTDKNGVKIFEGDIVKEYKSKDKVKGVVKFGEYQSGINKYADDLGFYVEWTTENFLIRELGYWCRKNMLEVIGNIHDNPELLEGSNK